MLLCTILVAAAYMGTGYLFAHMPNKIYSENSQINLQINALEKRLYTIFLFVSNICNTGAYLGIIRDIASSNWIGGVGMGIYIFLELIPAAIIVIMFFWLRKEKERILSQDSTPFYIDDDYYWRKGPPSPAPLPEPVHRSSSFSCLLPPNSNYVNPEANCRV